MSRGDEIVLGSVTFSSAHAPVIIDRMAESIVDLLLKLAAVEAERDFYKAAAGKLMSEKPRKRRRKQ